MGSAAPGAASRDGAPGNAAVLATYRQVAAVLMPNPAASSAIVSPVRRQARTSRACPAGVELASGSADPLPVPLDDTCGVIKGLAGQWQPGRTKAP